MRQHCSVQKDYERWPQETLPSQQIPLIKRGAHKNSPSVRTVVETTHEDGKPAQHTNLNAMGVGALATGRITVSAPKLNNEDKAARNRGRSQSRPRRGSHNKSVNMVNEHDDEPECRQDQWQDIVYDTINIHSYTTEHNRTKAFATLRIFPNNNSEAKVDSGAEGNTLPLRTFKSMFPNDTDTQGHPAMKETMGVRLTTYNGSALKCHGQVESKCEYQGSTKFLCGGHSRTSPYWASHL